MLARQKSGPVDGKKRRFLAVISRFALPEQIDFLFSRVHAKTPALGKINNDVVRTKGRPESNALVEPIEF
jgi:hypothetical protein